MKLKINSAYECGNTTLIPRSHYNEQGGLKYAIFQMITREDNRYVCKHTTLTQKEIRKVLMLAKNEKVDII